MTLAAGRADRSRPAADEELLDEAGPVRRRRRRCAVAGGVAGVGQAEAVVELQHPIGLDRDRRPGAVVVVVGVRHDRVQAVVAARELEDDKDALGVHRIEARHLVERRSQGGLTQEERQTGGNPSMFR